MTPYTKNICLVFMSIILVLSCNIEDMGGEKIKTLIKNSDEIIDKSDDDLISAISSSSKKIEVNPSKLPDIAKSTINSDYSSMIIETVFEEPSLGFEVNLKGIANSQIGLTNKTYFSKKGRELVSKNKKKSKRPFKFVFPLSYSMPDGSVITGENQKDMKTKMKAWYEANPDSKEKGKLVFPVNLKFGDKIVTINSEEEMKALMKKLNKKKSKRPFKFVFPLSYSMPDGSVITGENQKDMKTKMKAWYEANPDSKEKGKLVFPVNLKFGDKIVTINSKEEMKALIEKLKKRNSSNSNVKK